MGTSLLARIIDRLRGRRSLAEYYAWLLRHGRITEGRVLDTSQNESGVVIVYRYFISNVQYESAHQLTPQQLHRSAQYLPGAVVTVRFDPKHPTRSIVQ
jgi:hypothetical protein